MRRNFEKAEAAASQHENPTRTSRLRIERIVLLVLGFLLAAAFIVIYRLAFQMIQTNQAVQTLKEENEVLRRNLSDYTCWKCEAGWELHGVNCYYFSTNKSSWEDGRRLCKNLEGDLVKIDSRDEQIFLAQRLKELMKNDDDKFWIGLTDSAEEGRWLWVDGSLLSESFWRDQEPDNLSKDGASQADCGRMGEKKGVDNLKSWFDISCLYLQKSICEKVFEEEPSCEKDWVRFEETCYYFSTNKFSWEESRNRCREAGAERVKVETREEQYFLRNNLNGKMKSFDDMFWIGLTDSEEEGRWVWVDGSELSESLMFWNALQPDNWAKENPAGEDCVRVGMEGGGGGPMKNWYDKDCSAAQKRICEKLRDTTTE